MWTKRARTGILAALLLLGSTSQVSAVIDDIIGVNSPAGGTLVIKRFRVPSGSVVVGIEIKNNDDRTVFPRIALVRGVEMRLSEGSVLAEGTNVGATARHRVRLVFPPVVIQEAQDVYVAITWPPSDGVQGIGNGAGIGATRLESPGDCFIASREGDDFQRLSADLAIDLLYQGFGKAGAGDGARGEVVLRTFLLASNPNVPGKNAIIDFGVDRSMPVKLVIYNVAGQRVRGLADETLAAGVYSRQWNGRDDGGRTVATGVYLVRLTVASEMLAQKLVMTK